MSCRINIAGFDLRKMRTLIGSRSPTLIDELCAAFDKSWSDAETKADGYAIIERAVMEGTPFPDLQIETEIHATAACMFARHDQNMHALMSSTWNAQAFGELLRELPKKLPPLVRVFLRAMRDGTPLFGQEIRSSWSYYAYFAHAKVQAFHTALVDFQTEHPRFTGQDFCYGFLDELVDWLRQINEAKRDLWYVAW